MSDSDDSFDSDDSPPTKRRIIGESELRRQRCRDALYPAYEKDDTTAVSAILATYPDMANSAQLHAAATCNCPGVVRMFLDRGIDVSDLDAFRGTPLHAATTTAVVRLLIDRGADVNARAVCGFTPLISVMHNSGSRESVALLLGHGANVHGCDDAGRTPLHHAVIGHAADITTCSGQRQKYHLAVVGMLLEAGADANVHQEHLGETPLFHARTREMALLLLKGGADPAASDKFGRPALPRDKFPDLTNEIIRNASAITRAQHPRLGADSPANLLVGFGWISEYIVRMALPHWPGDPEPVLY
ncbi:MAG: ankyrin repeat domain-containing protein [Candidatus Omnitrophota bacterium]